MRALEELPNATKDRMLPIIHLRPWTTAFLLQSGLDRLNEAYGDRPTVIAIGPEEYASTLRPVHRELTRLRVAEGGYRNWCDFIADTGHDHFIPAVQIEEPDHIEAQISCFYELGRGLVIIIPKHALGGVRPLASSVSKLTNGGRNTCFIIDEQVMSRDSLTRASFLSYYCSVIRDSCPFSAISISGSSFPFDFTKTTDQHIFERLLFDEVSTKMSGTTMIYSDRGSARVERVHGGGGVPAPRIDYPQATKWDFFRTQQEGFPGYKEVALELLNHTPPVFDHLLRVWGTLMIERTANGDTAAIKTPARATAVRINLHLQRQTFYNDPISLYDTEDVWSG